MIYSYNFGEDFDFEPEWDVRKTAIIKVLKRYFKDRCDLQDYQAELVAEEVYDFEIDDALEEIFEEKLYAEFEPLASEEYNNMCADEREYSSWFGTKNDVRGC